ncbi:MAG: hypothetical protein ABI832_02975 [bacterium]
MRFLMVLALMALPAQADDCVSGKATRVSYSDGHALTIIQRHGDDLTYTQPYDGGTDAVSKTHLMLFPKEARFGARMVENRWTSRLPNMKDLKPGYHFDIKGTMKSGQGDAVSYRNEGEVLRMEEVKVGTCSYPALVVAMNTYLSGELIITSTNYLSPELEILLQSDVVLISAGKRSSYKALAVQ